MRDLECEIWLTLRGRVLGIHQLDFLFNFGGHKARLKGSRAKGESPMDSRTSSTTEILHRYGTREERFSFFLHHCIGLKSSPLSVPILVLNRMNRWKQVPADLPAKSPANAQLAPTLPPLCDYSLT